MARLNSNERSAISLFLPPFTRPLATHLDLPLPPHLAFVFRTPSMASSSTLPSTHSTTSTRLKLPSPLSSLTSAGTSRGGGGMSGHRKAQLDKERAQLDSMLDVAFGYDSAEKLAWIEVSPHNILERARTLCPSPPARTCTSHLFKGQSRQRPFAIS